MKSPRMAVFAALLFFGLSLTGASAQAFFPNRVKGTLEVRFLPPVGGQFVDVTIDDQPAGTLPLTVYVLPGAHRFTFTSAGEEPKSLVYPVKADTVVPSLFSAKAYPLTVNTNVPGAQIAIDGRGFPGNTTTVTPGNHSLTVSAPGFQAISLPFNQPASANTVNITLVANTFPLTVNTNVPGAPMALDGAPFQGNTISVTPGNHTLTVSAPGFQAVTVPFNQPAGANVLNITLVANTFPLTVNTNVPGAALALDGAPFPGRTTSALPGNHSLTVSAPGFQTLTVPFVQPNGPHTLNLTLVASTGTLQIVTDRLPPARPGYKILIDGVEVRGPQQALLPGSHTVRVSAGNLSFETSVTIASGQTLTLTPSVVWDLR